MGPILFALVWRLTPDEAAVLKVRNRILEEHPYYPAEPTQIKVRRKGSHLSLSQTVSGVHIEVVNNSRKPVSFWSQNNLLSGRLEALDGGKWICIEKSWGPSCGNGFGPATLRSGFAYIFDRIVRNGSWHTKVRWAVRDSEGSTISTNSLWMDIKHPEPDEWEQLLANAQKRMANKAK